MTINATAPVLLALYTAVADETGVPRDRLRGTVQNDILKEYIARGTYIYPVRPSLRLVSDLMAFAAAELPRWNAISVSGYHIREAGSTAAQEVAFTLSNGVEYVRRALARGIALEDFAPRISFFFAAHNDLLEEVAKFRAARRIWARVMKERFGASDRSCRLRFHTQTGGSTLTAQQPLNNVVRVTVQALAGVLGRHPVAAHQQLRRGPGAARRGGGRAGAEDPADPRGGIGRGRVGRPPGRQLPGGAPHRPRRGGGAGAHGADRGDGRFAPAAIGYMRDEIHRAAYRHQLSVEAGTRVVVGVNRHMRPGNRTSLPPGPTSGSWRRGRLRRWRRSGRGATRGRWPRRWMT